MSMHSVTLASLATLAFAMPCATPRLPNTIGDVVRTTEDVAALSAKKAQCDKIARDPVATEEEDTIGQTVALEFIRRHGLVQGRTAVDKQSEAARALNRLGASIALLSDRPDLTWSFAILDDEVPNAFALPGGYVLVTKGLLREVENEAQLAGILAHEIGHVVHGHPIERYRKVKTNFCNVAVAGDAIDRTGYLQDAWNDSPIGFLDFNSARGIANNLGVLEELSAKVAESFADEGNPKKDELTADAEAVKLMIVSGYAPAELAKFLQKLPEPKNLVNHPPSAERAKHVSKLVDCLGGTGGVCFGKDDALLAAGHPFGAKEGFKSPPVAKELATF